MTAINYKISCFHLKELLRTNNNKISVKKKLLKIFIVRFKIKQTFVKSLKKNSKIIRGETCNI